MHLFIASLHRPPTQTRREGDQKEEEPTDLCIIMQRCGADPAVVNTSKDNVRWSWTSVN